MAKQDILMIEAEAMGETLKVCRSVVSPMASLPVLSCVQITAGGNGLDIYATDIDTCVRVRLPAKGAAGDCCIKAKTLAEIVKLAADEVDLEFKDGAMGLRLMDANYLITTLPAEEMPPLQKLKVKDTWTMRSGALRRMLNIVAPAMSNDANRYVLNGALLSHRNDVLTLTATDGRRMHQARTDYSGSSDFAWILPDKAVAFLAKHLSASDIEVKVTAGDQTIRLEWQNVLYQTKLIDGTYPDVKKVIPDDDGTLLTIRKTDMVRAIDEMTVLHDQKVDWIKLSLLKKGMRIETLNTDIGKAEAVVPVEATADLKDTIALSAPFLWDAVHVVDDTNVTIGVTDALSPIVVRDKSFLAVIMPLRLG